MTKYREILRLTALGLSLRDIEKSLKVSRKTVVKVQKRADELSLSWPLGESLTDAELEQRMFPKDLSPKSTKRMPDFDYIRKELLKNGVNKKLLWTEYLEECSQNGDDALMYSQFCYYIQQNEQKSRATMHIPRKAGQQIEVDWADDPAKLIDPDTGEITEAWIFVGVMTYSQYAFVEAFINEQQKSWTTAHVHMYEFFGGFCNLRPSSFRCRSPYKFPPAAAPVFRWFCTLSRAVCWQSASPVWFCRAQTLILSPRILVLRRSASAARG